MYFPLMRCIRRTSIYVYFVVFFGVNHHNQTIVFVVDVVSSETEETYV